MKGGDEPQFILDAQNYENLSLNIAEITRWVREANDQLNHYRGEPDDEAESN